MPQKLTLPLALIAAPFLFAADKPASSLTPDQMQSAYNVAVKQIAGMVKNPKQTGVEPIDQATFSTGSRESIDVRLNTNSPKADGTRSQQGWVCRVWPLRDDGKSPASCYPFSTRPPKDSAHWSPPLKPAGSPPPQEGTPAPATTAAITDAAVPPPPVVTMMSINVTSDPKEAFVMVDNYPAGQTPVDVKLAKGEYTLKVFKEGFKPWSQKVSVEQGKDQTVDVSLVTAPTAPRPAAPAAPAPATRPRPATTVPTDSTVVRLPSAK
ncbi:MAG TPA: PEGA domain-containing protein [Bryobacteraceae bacterium]|nr:PEGA domain-containing protein [Bryobacteraceae bacterium]